MKTTKSHRPVIQDRQRRAVGPWPGRNQINDNLPLPFGFGSNTRRSNSGDPVYKKLYKVIKKKGYFTYSDIESFGYSWGRAASFAQDLKRNGIITEFSRRTRRWELIDDSEARI